MSWSSWRCPSRKPGPGEVRIRLAASGINPGDVKNRQDAFGYGMLPPRHPHSDEAGTRYRVGEGIAPPRAGAHEVVRTGGAPPAVGERGAGRRLA
jgi:NADPH:quinone reductase-like Zn-dependent oxidoreductase